MKWGPKMSNKELKLVNYMEIIVFQLLDEVLAKKDICKCERCQLDIAAIALNNLPHKYVVSSKGKAYAKTDILNEQLRTDVTVEILKAIDVVSKKPNHKE